MQTADPAYPAGLQPQRRFLGWICLAAVVLCASPCGADDYRSGFEPGPVSWRPLARLPAAAIRTHSRTSGGATHETVEAFSFATDRAVLAAAIAHPVPRTPAFDEVRAAVSVRTTRCRIRLALQFECPNVIDPETGRPVVFELPGDRYDRLGAWQTLTCGCAGDALQSRLALLRSTLRRDGHTGAAEFNDLVVRAVVLQCDVPPGQSELQIDDLRFGPLAEIERTSATTPLVAPPSLTRGSGPGPIELTPGGQIRVDGRPFVVRMAPYRGEAVDVLRAAGLNTAWIDSSLSPDVRATIRENGMWLTAAPPAIEQTAASARPESDLPAMSAAFQSTPVAIGPETRDILFWTIGTRLSEGEIGTLDASVGALRQADRLYERPRPIAADVLSNERTFSRRLDFVGSSVPFANGGNSPKEYFRELTRRRRLKVSGSRNTTWVSTEADAAVAALTDGQDVLIEPEQIWLQAELAIAAGYQGLNYWTRTPLDGDGPIDAERRAALSILNCRLDLIADWVATGQLDGVFPVRTAGAEPTSYRPEIVAAVFRCDRGQLVLLVSLDDASHVVPAPMAASDIRVTVRGGDQMSQAYEISEVGVRSVDSSRVSGGTEISLPHFDQSALLLLTPYEPVAQDLRDRTLAARPRMLDAWVELASAKLERVANTHAAIEVASSRPLRGGDAQLSEARSQVDRARDAAAASDHQECRRCAKLALQMLRVLQTRHTENALDHLYGPGATPGSLAFSSLPAHWRTLNVLGRSEDRGVALEAGFDSLDELLASGWRSVAVPDNPAESAVELAPAEEANGLVLRMAAAESASPEHDPSGRRATVVSPSVQVDEGELLLVKARVRGVPGRKPGRLLLSDPVYGPTCGLRVTVSPERWQDLELVRPAGSGGRFELRMDLLGSGVVCVDSITIRAFGEMADPEPPVTEPPAEDADRGPLPRLPRFPRWWADAKSGRSEKNPPSADINENAAAPPVNGAIAPR